MTLHSDFSDNADAPTLARHARTVLPKVEAPTGARLLGLRAAVGKSTSDLKS